MRITLKTELVVSFLVVVTVLGVIATIVGVRLIGSGIVRQAQEKVRLDLNSAREIYNHKLKEIEHVIAFTSIRVFIKDALPSENRAILYDLLAEVREKAQLDILTITNATGQVVLRTSNPECYGDSQTDNEFVSKVLVEQHVLAATQILTQETLLKESAELAQQARIRLVQTPKAQPRQATEETSGMMLKAAAPIFDNHERLIGVLYGGKLINRDVELVDDIRATIYQDAVYKGKREGIATIFQDDVRIATNVLDQAGKRAIGTQVSTEVHERVVDRGEPWIDRAFVVNAWHITAYEPIRNIAGDVVGILSVGMPEQRFVDMQRNAIMMFVGITIAGAMLALVIAYFLASDLLKPIKQLVTASQELSEGNLAYRIDPISNGELGELEKTFNFMATTLKERDDALKEQTQRQLIQSEKLASIGRLAAGVAHQINNPLTGILTYSSLLLKNKAKDDSDREDLQVIVDETMRCRAIVNDLLGFSKQTEPQKKPVDLNQLITNALALAKNQASLNNVNIISKLCDQLPHIVADGNQIQEVFLNIIVNAIDAMPQGGDLRVNSCVIEDHQWIRFTFADTGEGIAPENMDKVFDPFFTTKDTKGTGLGLAIAYGIIEKHQGKISITSEVGKGTTCTIDLPNELKIED